MGKVTPDEFRVVTKAPLVLPPGLFVAAPGPGRTAPTGAAAESAARQALLGQRDSEVRSEGERLLAQKAGPTKRTR